ncbi:hypothetical protein PMY12_19165 [Clostridium tertium]|uniref:hypothetical protein n=2 Tax=Clostridium tertium TaxID=1559 RepID=UPI002330574D|nr:hypothetical protein [Clostridium tertium]MDB1935363.1 hypothetical protein [Clostridium tertium]MDB1939121.1 hypothetical protein [Clostridium tertium]
MSKFKVGDKVVKADGEKWVTGEKYKKITSENSIFGYTVNRSLGYWKEEELELYKEDKMEKTFKEVIANIKEGEVWDDGFLKIQMKRGTISIGSLNEEPFKNIIGFVINPCKKFKLQRKEYKFDEAFKAYEEGKEIESCEGCKFKRCDKDVVLIIDFAGDKIKRSSCEELFSIKEIRGKWYIND